MTLKQIRRKALTDLELQRSMDLLPLNSRIDTRIRDGLDLSSRKRSRNKLPFFAHDTQVRNTMSGSRSCVMVSEGSERLSSGLSFNVQVRNTISGSGSNVLNPRDLESLSPLRHNVRVRNTLSGSQLNINKTYDYDKEDNMELAQQGRKDDTVHSVQILESDKVGLDLIAIPTIGEARIQTMSNQMNIEFTDEPGFVDPKGLARRRFQSDLQRSEPNAPTVSIEINDMHMRNPDNIDFLKSMTQVLESLKDNWSSTMKGLLTDQEERVEKLEQGLAAVSSFNR